MGPIARPRIAVFQTAHCLAAAILIAAAWRLGGWPWAALWALAFALTARRNGSAAALAAAGPALVWLMLFRWTGDRRLFFPFAMQLAHASSPVPLAAAFFAVRLQQAATAHLLAIELIVAAAVLAAGRALQRQVQLTQTARLAVSGIVAILSLLGLLL